MRSSSSARVFTIAVVMGLVLSACGSQQQSSEPSGSGAPSTQPTSNATGGTVRANALTFRSADSTLTFRGKVHVHLTRDQAKTAKPAVPALPEPAAAVPALPEMPAQQDAGTSGWEAQ